MSAGVKQSAASIIAVFCGSLPSDRADEPEAIGMAREVITALAISNMCVMPPVERVLKPTPFVNQFVNLNRDIDPSFKSEPGLTGTVIGSRLNL